MGLSGLKRSSPVLLNPKPTYPKQTEDPTKPNFFVTCRPKTKSPVQLNYPTYIALETQETKNMNSPPHLHCLSLHLNSRHTQQFSHTKISAIQHSPQLHHLCLTLWSHLVRKILVFCLNLTFRIVQQEKKKLSCKNTGSRFKNIKIHDLSKEFDLLLLPISTTSMVYCQFLHLFFQSRQNSPSSPSIRAIMFVN